MMKNKDIMLCLRRLKDEGIPYCRLSEELKIPLKKFYRFTYKRNFPIIERQQIENYLMTNFKDIVIDECFSK